MIIWLMGLPGSGKSTLATALKESFDKADVQSFVLDGDVLRKGICADLGFSVKDRSENVRRIAHLSKLMSQAGLVVIVASILPLEELRVLAREIIDDEAYYEIYLKCPLNVCQTRDPKGLYKKALNGEVKDFTGISAPFEEPVQPDLVIDTNKLSGEQSLEIILQSILLPEQGRGL
ncbi:adenylylsulfate kinase [Mucilaginibacter yixingensis]|uniref:Adenylyl-sulfate kinase n=1 Tax=Mucilaginibacter yixingensis TaxID=1295612 RepID=A0A2T5JCF6_9SPHI|nr:adenylyl-sulfate kinase [Mucilaginibacter yixingensis]PTQ99449.1 adenylylsulfate kinase [Mucilaginibacter yixingensis]